MNVHPPSMPVNTEQCPESFDFSKTLMTPTRITTPYFAFLMAVARVLAVFPAELTYGINCEIARLCSFPGAKLPVHACSWRPLRLFLAVNLGWRNAGLSSCCFQCQGLSLVNQQKRLRKSPLTDLLLMQYLKCIKRGEISLANSVTQLHSIH